MKQGEPETPCLTGRGPGTGVGQDSRDVKDELQRNQCRVGFGTEKTMSWESAKTHVTLVGRSRFAQLDKKMWQRKSLHKNESQWFRAGTSGAVSEEMS